MLVLDFIASKKLTAIAAAVVKWLVIRPWKAVLFDVSTNYTQWNSIKSLHSLNSMICIVRIVKRVINRVFGIRVGHISDAFDLFLIDFANLKGT